MVIVIDPIITNLIPISLRPSVNDLTIASIKINDVPNMKIRIPIVINALNRDKLLFFENLNHHVIDYILISNNMFYNFIILLLY